MESADLENRILTFVAKSFGFERRVTVGGHDVAVFGRTETESESRFRPKLVRLKVALPVAWLVVDLASDALLVARDGAQPLARGSSEARETSSEASSFAEQGIRWRRVAAPAGGFVYAPEELAEVLLSAAALAEIAPSAA